MTDLTRIDPITKRRARQLRHEMSEAERRLWRHLRGRQVEGYKFRHQHPWGRYVLGFVCLESRLVVEIGWKPTSGTESLRPKVERMV
jgi:very-short-patch-repair endonuclease